MMMVATTPFGALLSIFALVPLGIILSIYGTEGAAALRDHHRGRSRKL